MDKIKAKKVKYPKLCAHKKMVLPANGLGLVCPHCGKVIGATKAGLALRAKEGK